MQVKMKFRHVGTHGYFHPSKGSITLSVDVTEEATADFFGSRLAKALSDEDETIEYAGIERPEDYDTLRTP